jgi:hypothetical protein
MPFFRRSASEAEALLEAGTTLVSDSDSKFQSDVPAQVLGEAPTRKRPPPIWCFQSHAILEAMLTQAGHPEMMPGPTEFLNETKGKCLNRQASERLTASGAVSWVRTHNVYRGQLPFLDQLDERLEQSLGLAAVHGGSWQITSYDHGERCDAHTIHTLHHTNTCATPDTMHTPTA